MAEHVSPVASRRKKLKLVLSAFFEAFFSFKARFKIAAFSGFIPFFSDEPPANAIRVIIETPVGAYAIFILAVRGRDVKRRRFEPPLKRVDANIERFSRPLA